MKLLSTPVIVIALVIGLAYWLAPEKPRSASAVSVVFNDPSFSFQLMRTMGGAVYKTADIGECLVTAKNIHEGDFESWYANWHALAQKLENRANTCLKNGHPHSAHELFLRASSYYRTAEFYLHGNQHDPRIIQSWKKHHECFSQALELGGTEKFSAQSVEIPYENTTLPGYFYRPAPINMLPKKTILIQTGFDGTQEELYGRACAAIERGYNVLTFEGPGQGRVIRIQHLRFRADWEKVITPIIDFVCTQPDVDKNKICLYGLSLGGYLAPRGASEDHRLAALVANGGVFDLFSALTKRAGFKTRQEFIEFLKNKPQDADKLIYKIKQKSVGGRWTIEHGMYVFGTNTPHEYLLKFSEMTLCAHAQKITCPTLICDAQTEMPELAGQSKKLFDALTCPKTFMQFKAADGADLHCQIGAQLQSNQQILDWLDETIEKQSLNTK